MRAIVRNSIFMALFNLFGRASGFVRYFLLVAYLSEPNFALITFGLNFGRLARTFIDGGLDNLIARDGARNYSEVPRFYFNGLVMKTVLSLLFFAGGLVYLGVVRDLSRGEIVVVYASLAGSFMLSLTGVTRSCFTAVEKMEYVFYSNLPARLISIFLLFLALWFGLPLLWSALAISLENLLWFIILGAIGLRFFPLSRHSFSLSKIGYMLGESWSLALYGFFNVFYMSLDVIMIEYIMGDPDFVAPYTYASLLVEGVTMLLTGYIIAIYPALSRYHLTDQKAYHRLFSRSVEIVLVCTLPLSVAMAFWAHGWMNFIRETGPLSGQVLQVLAANLNFSMLNTLVIIVFTSSNRQRWLVIFTGFAVLVSFFSNWAMITRYDQVGAAAATLFSQVLLFIFMAVAAKRMFNIHFPWKRPLQVLGVSLLAGVITYAVPGLPLFAVPFLYGGFLLGLGWMFQVVTPQELREWRAMMKTEEVVGE